VIPLNLVFRANQSRHLLRHLEAPSFLYPLSIALAFLCIYIKMADYEELELPVMIVIH
jgi:hypothetical protein